MSLTTRSPAKINLYLDILGCREDGYHDIATLFLPLPEPADTLTLEDAPSGELRVCCSHPSVPEGPENLCWQAAQAFAAAAGVQPAWTITIDKQIPVAAGLGGGSSNAASVLKLLNGVIAAPLPDTQLRHLAAELGADVPFFLAPQTAVARGIGEILTPVACSTAVPLVLVDLGFPVPVSWSYRRADVVKRPAPPDLNALLHALESGSLDGIAPLTYNALEYAVLDKFPILEMLIEFLLTQGCLAAHISGSGPTVYGICPSDSGCAIAAAVHDTFGSCARVFATVA